MLNNAIADHFERNVREMVQAEARALDNNGHYKAASKVRGLANGIATLSAENLALRDGLDAILELDADDASFGMIRAQQIARAALLNATKQRLGVKPPAIADVPSANSRKGWHPKGGDAKASPGPKPCQARSEGCARNDPK